MKSPYEDLQPEETSEKELADKPDEKSSAFYWVLTCIVLAGFAFTYRFIVSQKLEQTAVMFIALPAVLAIACSFVPRPSSHTGRIMKGITMAMLMLGILAMEGFICIVIASPLAYLVGLIIGIVSDINQKDSLNYKPNKNRKIQCAAYLAIALMSVEGVNEHLSFSRDETVTISKSYPLSQKEVIEKLSAGPDFDLTELPAFLKLGFPEPQKITGSGMQVGDTWEIYFAGGEGHPGTLTVEVTESTENSITLTAIDDTSHIAHWLTWETATWKFEDRGGSTEVTLSLDYTRELDPYWYFKPVERYGVSLAAGYFMDQTLQSDE